MLFCDHSGNEESAGIGLLLQSSVLNSVCSPARLPAELLRGDSAAARLSKEQHDCVSGSRQPHQHAYSKTPLVQGDGMLLLGLGGFEAPRSLRLQAATPPQGPFQAIQPS